MTSAATTSAPAFFGRLYWMMVGPFALAICAIRITRGSTDGFGPFDMVYFASPGWDVPGALHGIPAWSTDDRGGRTRHGSPPAPILRGTQHSRSRHLGRSQAGREPADPYPRLKKLALVRDESETIVLMQGGIPDAVTAVRLATREVLTRPLSPEALRRAVETIVWRTGGFVSGAARPRILVAGIIAPGGAECCE